MLAKTVKIDKNCENSIFKMSKIKFYKIDKNLILRNVKIEFFKTVIIQPKLSRKLLNDFLMSKVTKKIDKLMFLFELHN